MGERSRPAVPIFSLEKLQPGDSVDMQAYRLEMKRQVAQAGVPMYGLPLTGTDPGAQQFIGGVRASGRQLVGVELAHVYPTADIPSMVRIETAILEQVRYEIDLAIGADIQSIVRDLHSSSAGDTSRAQFTGDLPWRDVTLLVDDTPLGARALRAKDVRLDDPDRPGSPDDAPDWVIRGELTTIHADDVRTGQVVSLRVRGYRFPLDELELVRVRDLEPYT